MDIIAGSIEVLRLLMFVDMEGIILHAKETTHENLSQIHHAPSGADLSVWSIVAPSSLAARSLAHAVVA